MAKVDKETKEQIKNLTKKQLEDIVIKWTSQKDFYDYLIVNYLDIENGENELFEQTKKDIDLLFLKKHKGYSDELKLANYIKAVVKRINEFTKISKNKKLEADLLVYLLDMLFEDCSDYLGTCFETYDTQLAIQVRKLINITSKYLHEDYRIEFIDKINNYLEILHKESRHIDMVYDMPEKIV